jgi:hypothetical protein
MISELCVWFEVFASSFIKVSLVGYDAVLFGNLSQTVRWNLPLPAVQFSLSAPKMKAEMYSETSNKLPFNTASYP